MASLPSGPADAHRSASSLVASSPADQNTTRSAFANDEDAPASETDPLLERGAAADDDVANRGRAVACHRRE